MIGKIDAHELPFTVRAICRGMLTDARLHVTTSGTCTQVEDMLKRSFLEFHAQKAAPEALDRRGEGPRGAGAPEGATLARLGRRRHAGLRWSGIVRSARRIEELSAELQVRP